jgi:hypothetical protein
MSSRQVYSSTSYLLAVTTSTNKSPELEERAQSIARELNGLYAPRSGGPLAPLFAETLAERIIVVEQGKLSLHDQSGAEYRYHPNLALVRGLNYLRGQGDTYLRAAELSEGETVLDCTLGFGTEALLAALVVGANGEVIGLESVPELALLSREGMRQFRLVQKPLAEAMRRVGVVTADYRDYLPRAASHSADLVYFDPFFGEPVSGSEHTILPLARFGNRSPLDSRSVMEARRVARRRVLIKQPRNMDLSEIAGDEGTLIGARRGHVSYLALPPF